MSRLTDIPPETVDVGGVEWPINTAFWVGVAFERLMTDPEMDGGEKTLKALQLYYGDNIPADIEGAIDALLWFFRCGEESPEGGSGGGTSARAYDFDQDAEYIYAAFRQVYGIDLWATDLHWWAFHAMFLALPDECRITQIMGYRVADLKGLSKQEKKRYEKLKRIYALKRKTTVEHAINLEERDRAWLAKVNAVYAAAKGG